MPYNFETAGGDIYIGNQLVPGAAPTLDKVAPFYSKLPEWAYPKPNPLAGVTLPKLPNLPGFNINIDTAPLVLPLMLIGGVLLLGKKD